MQGSAVHPWHSWNWSGDHIVHTPIVRACRTIPGRARRYDIDIRQFLTTASNAVVGRTLSKIIDALPAERQALFRSHERGSFDFRADAMVQFIGTLKYLRAHHREKTGPDAWLFPDETLEQGGGDCEDLAFVLAALLLAAGVSSYCIRVALGTLTITPPRGKRVRHDHCWVMYQNESGVWEILEPLAALAADRKRPKTARAAATHATDYAPDYVFNAEHLWVMDSRYVSPARAFDDYCGTRRNFWKHFDPSFAAGVHATIFETALQGLAPASAIAAMKRKSLWLDGNIFTYDPRDHFDNGFIDEGWARVQTNLAQFQKDNTAWDSFAAAGHAIADFYAHSSYGHFAQLQAAPNPAGQVVVYSPGGGWVAAPSYTGTPPAPALPPCDLTAGKFSTNPELWSGTHDEAAVEWAGELISGRYAQLHDPSATFFEGCTSLPTVLANAADFKRRGSLPHHNEIAVDGPSLSGKHRLYSQTSAGPADRQSYDNQFRWRRNGAIAHVQQAFQDNWHG
jgi:hypothetical protein